jgi:N4-(beta-N-acetylglucosaminyl)-L-asparaginase
MSTTRREFLQCASTVGAGVAAAACQSAVAAALQPPKAVAISSGNGLRAVNKAVEMMLTNSDALDAAIAGVNILEDDPNDTSVGYGGLPNEDGDVELDAAVMHGPTHRAGSVASLRNIKNPSKVARLVMERSDHVLLVGRGAVKFAKAHGFVEENLLTNQAREAWLRWKENMSTRDDWLPPHTPDEAAVGALFAPFVRQMGTIHCSALDLRGNLSCVTTTSGLAFKIAGRVGDSPIIGAGLYCDNDIGSAGSTGRGEANLVNCSSVFIVESMRQGKTPEQACLDACQRIADHNRMRRLKRDDGRPNFNVSFYALNKQGAYGAASIHAGPKFTVHDGTTSRALDCAYLYGK